MIFSSISELRLLYTTSSSPCISIYMPTHRAGEETRQDPIRFKNLLGQAEDRLRERGMRTVDIEKLLEPARKLLGYSPFWRHLADGLAMFIHTDLFRYYPLSLNFEEQIVVADHFYLKPLFPLLTGDGRFFVLALSQNEVRLIEGTRENVNEVDLEDIPQNLAETLGPRSRDRLLQFHTRTGSGYGKRPAVYWGKGAGEDENRQDVIRFFRKIDQGLLGLLPGERVPLILAGVDYLLALYRDVNSNPYLIKEGILGNPEDLSSKELHKRAWDIIEPQFLEEQKDVINRYKRLAGTEQASNEIEVILPAAYHGRVDCLIVSRGVQKWGKYNLLTSQIQVYSVAEPGNEDLLQTAAIQAILNRGTVYAVQQEEAPQGSQLAAIFRY